MSNCACLVVVITRFVESLATMQAKGTVGKGKVAVVCHWGVRMTILACLQRLKRISNPGFEIIGDLQCHGCPTAKLRGGMDSVVAISSH